MFHDNLRLWYDIPNHSCDADCRVVALGNVAAASSTEKAIAYVSISSLLL